MNLFRGTSALLITNPTNIRYLTGFVGVAPEEREAYVLLTQNQIYLFTNSLYLESSRNLKAQISNIKPEITLVEITRENPLSKKLAKVTKELGSKKLGFEENDLTVAEYNELAKELKGVMLVLTKNRIEDMRMIKRDDEIENIRLAADITDQCFKFISHRIRPGVTEARLAMEIEGFLKIRGGETAFAPIIAFNEHSSQPHYHGRGNDPLRRGSLILLDFGAKINGYCADMTRVVFVYPPKDEWKRAYETVLKAQLAALNYLHLEGAKAHLPGGARTFLSAQGPALRTGAEADRRAREVIEKAGFPAYPHSLGHAVGLEIHEAPRLSAKKDEKLKQDMVITIEPAIYIESQYGIRIEDLVLIKERGIEILSKSPKELTVVS